MEKGLTKRQIIQELSRSVHGELKQYVPIIGEAARTDPDFLAHLIAWNESKGQVRDTKVALPVIALRNGGIMLPDTRFPTPEHNENALAHLALLDPRELLKAYRFVGEVGQLRTQVRKVIRRYLRKREKSFSWWDQTVVQHRESMKALYALVHLKPQPERHRLVLFEGQYPEGSVFDDIFHLKDMTPLQAAGAVLKHKLPFLVVVGAAGGHLKDDTFVLSMLEHMTPTEVVTNMKMLEKYGVRERPALRAALESKLQEVAKSKKQVFKTTQAASRMTNTVLRDKLVATQEKQIDSMKGIDGNWLVLGDKSGSMEQAIELSKEVAAALVRLVRGKVHLVFFDVSPHHMDVTGMTYEQIAARTKFVQANGGTSVGVGLDYAIQRGLEIDGIAIISDAQENQSPSFVERYKRFCALSDKEPPVYLYRMMPGVRSWADHDVALQMQSAGFDIQEFDLRRGDVDYHSLPNLITTMRANKFSLVDEIMETPLKTLDQVFA